MKELSFKSVFTPFFLLIFSAVFLSTLTDQFIALKVERLVSSPNGLSDMIWVWGLLSLVSAIFFPMLFAVLCSYNIVKSPPKLGEYFKENIELSMIESLRAWGKSFMWSLLFILPGIAKFILYTLTPYVVLFSKKYKDGSVDALKYSTEICRANLKKINIWLTVFYLIIPITIYSVAEPYRLLRDYPLTGTTIVFIRTLAEYGFHYMMLKILFKYINEAEFADTLSAIPSDAIVEYSEASPASDDQPVDTPEDKTENKNEDIVSETPEEVPEGSIKEER